MFIFQTIPSINVLTTCGLQMECHFVYYNAYKYDMAFRLPLTNGTYELRYGFNATDYRGIVQVYFGEDLDHMHAVNIPIDLATDNWVNRCGYDEDTEELDYNTKVNKRMRNHGYMKGA